MTFGSLFAGIGGFDLGLERAGLTCTWQVEIDPFCRRVLEQHWPTVPKYDDVRTVGAHNLDRVDLICGGFPCQDISYAGSGAGMDGRRSGLWTSYARVVRELRPAYVLVENVAALLDRGLGRVLGDLADLGYDAEWHCIPASAFGAPHRRDRVWIVANAYQDGRAIITDAQGWLSEVTSPFLWQSFRTVDLKVWLSAYCHLPRNAHGLSRELDARAGALGNAVVPQVAEWIGRRLMDADGAR